MCHQPLCFLVVALLEVLEILRNDGVDCSRLKLCSHLHRRTEPRQPIQTIVWTQAAMHLLGDTAMATMVHAVSRRVAYVLLHSVWSGGEVAWWRFIVTAVSSSRALVGGETQLCSWIRSTTWRPVVRIQSVVLWFPRRPCRTPTHLPRSGSVRPGFLSNMQERVSAGGPNSIGRSRLGLY